MSFRVRIDPEAARAFGASGLDREDLLVALNRLYSTLENVPDAIRANRYRRQPELFLFRIVRAVGSHVHIFHCLVDDRTESDTLTVVFCFHETRER